MGPLREILKQILGKASLLASVQQCVRRNLAKVLHEMETA